MDIAYYIQGLLRQPNASRARQYLGIGSGGGGDVTEDNLSFSDVTTANSSTAEHGLLPKLSGNAAEVLNGAGNWIVPGGSGDVVGPAGAVADRVVVFNGATGKLIKDGGFASTQIPTAAENDALAGTNGVPSAANPYVTDSDPRNTNARTPSAHTHPQSEVTNLVTDLSAKAPTARAINTTAPLTGGGDLSADRTLAVSHASTTAKGVVELATSGENAAGVAVQGNDARLSDARTPTAHAASHASAGGDALTITNLGGFPGGGTTFLRDDGTFAAPPGGGSGLTQAQVLARTC